MALAPLANLAYWSAIHTDRTNLAPAAAAGKVAQESAGIAEVIAKLDIKLN